VLLVVTIFLVCSMASLFRGLFHTNQLVRTFKTDKSVWPLLVADLSGVAVLTIWLWHNNIANPDSHPNRSHRKDAMHGDAERVRRYLDHAPHNRGLELAKLDETREVMGYLNKSEVEKRLQAKYNY